MKRKLLDVPSWSKIMASTLLGMACTLPAFSQTYSFEDSVLPANWTVENATASFTTVHSTDAAVALMVTVDPGKTGVITCPFPTAKKQTNAKYNFHVEIYSDKVTETPLTVNFYDEKGGLHLSGNAVMNFKGWMPYYRSYTKDYGSKGMTEKAAKMTISIDNSNSTEPISLCFDNWNLAASLSSIMALPINIKDAADLNNQKIQPLILYSFSSNANKQNPLPAPTAEELSAIASIKGMLPLAPDASDTDLAEARNFAKGLDVRRNSDGTVKYNRIISKAAEYTKANEELVLRHLNALAASSDPADSQLFTDFMDAVLDANTFYRFPQLLWNTYADVRLIPRLMLALIPKLNDSQKSEWLKAVRWIIEEGWSNAPLDYFANNYNSDILYLNGGSKYFLSCAAYDPDPAVAAREMRAVKKMFELAVTPTTGGYGIIKPDGCGFHHGVNYNNYMYAFNPWINIALLLRDTPFCVNKEAYDNIKKAILTCYSMSTRSTPYSNPNDPTDPTNNLYAKSLSGRHPFAGGQVNQFFPNEFKQAVQLSEKFFGGSPDPELAAAYNYYTMTNTYQVPEKDFSGFYQYNYSPVGIYRGNDWVVTMRCPTTLAWGAEIYSKKNRFGRYQSTGSMEVMYSGCKSNSGLPLEPAGYDWNVVPGTTTVHYSDWKSMLPNGDLTTRFDQFSESTDYSGALAWHHGKAGMFSCDFVQSDAQNNAVVCYFDADATHLKFRKTIFAVDDMLFNLGTGITTQGNYNDAWITATNLFQEVGNDLTDFNVNGSMMNRNADPMEIDCSKGNVWMVSPKGTGIIIPKGNDNVVVKYGLQEGPHDTGATYDSAPETAIGAKAYIKHGVKVNNDKYSYLMVPATTADKLKGDVNDIVDRFDVISDDTFHGINYKPTGLTAISFFSKVDNTGMNFVKSVSDQMLVMYQKLDENHTGLAICLPNLKPDRVSSSAWDWKSLTVNSSIVLDGEWMCDGETPKNASVSASNGQTLVDVALSDGLPVYLDLKTVGAGVNELKIDDFSVRVSSEGDEIVVALGNASQEDVTVEVYDINGMKLTNGSIAAGTTACRLNARSNPINILRITSGTNTKIVKIVR